MRPVRTLRIGDDDLDSAGGKRLQAPVAQSDTQALREPIARDDDADAARGFEPVHRQVPEHDLLGLMDLERQCAGENVLDRMNGRIPPLPAHELSIGAERPGASVRIDLELQSNAMCVVERNEKV